MSSSNSLVHIVKASGLLPRLLAGSLALLALSVPAFAQDAVIRSSFNSRSNAPVVVSILTGQSCLLVFDRPIGRLAISNQEPAEAVPVAPSQLVVNAKAPGRTRLTTWSNQDEQFIFFDIDVRANLEQIDAQIRALFPKEDIRLSQANGSVVISGKADTKIAQQIESVVAAAGFKTVNLLAVPVQSIAQVQLQVRVVEVTRNKLSELAASPVVLNQLGQGGYTNTGQGPYTVGAVEGGNILGSVSSALNVFVMSNNAGMFIRALQTQGALRALAEPNLIAMNGQQASFLAGGEIPVPIVTNASGGSAVSILFKEYGVRVTFKPTIIDEQHIRLEVEPEVSTLDYANAVRFSGFVIPALRTRRAKTGIELQDGQSFGIAGLIDNNEQKSLSKIPILSDVPILGNLFKSKSFQKSESELVFIVTTKITQPLNPDAVPQMRGVDGLKTGSPLGVETPGAPGGGGSITGAAGSKNVSAPAGGALSIPSEIPSGSVGGEMRNNLVPANKGAVDDKGAANKDAAKGVVAGAPADAKEPAGGKKGMENNSPMKQSPAALPAQRTDDEGAAKGVVVGAPADAKEPIGDKKPDESKEPAGDKKPGESKEPAGGKGMENNGPTKQPPTILPAQRTTARTIDSLVWRLRVPGSPSLTAQRLQ